MAPFINAPYQDKSVNSIRRGDNFMKGMLVFLAKQPYGWDAITVAPRVSFGNGNAYLTSCVVYLI